MALSLLLGAGIGVGLVLILSGLWPARLTLGQELLRQRHGTPDEESCVPCVTAV
jgi:hypothetical protein